MVARHKNIVYEDGSKSFNCTGAGVVLNLICFVYAVWFTCRQKH
ncbi:hypothetical protein SALWKB29_0249 [Snodgrassella communis]|uniref:Uncharacterized protein n=1 Tax=Snodgrassella communis TaxID=2946699 RepID=A0A836MT72_9NEIS|nr:hypothetical protein SALWKB29_0249 [Snodgrassella communis]